MENQLYNACSLITIVVLVIFLCIDLITHVSLMGTAFVAGILALQMLCYYFSRKRHKFETSLVFNAILSYVAIIVNFCFDAGSKGPTLFIFFFTFHLLITATRNSLHLLWLTLHMVIGLSLLTLEFVSPKWVHYSYLNESQRLADLTASYIITLLLVYFVTLHLRNYYLQQKREAVQSGIKLKALLESTNSCQMLIGKNYEVLFCNYAVVQFIDQVYGRYLKEGDNFISYINPAFHNRFKQLYEAALRDEATQEEALLHYENGTSIWWQFMFAPARDNINNIIGVSYNAININNIKLQEEKIREKNASLIQIAHIQSHELRGPVTSVLGLLQLIKEEETVDRAYLSMMENVIKELDEKIHEIVQQTHRLPVE